MSGNDDEVLIVRRILERIESCSETELTDVMDSFAFDSRTQPQHVASFPSTPVSSATQWSDDDSRAHFLSPLQLPVLDDAHEIYHNSERPKVSPPKVYASPRIRVPDIEIFPSFDVICQRWRRSDDRWNSIREQAGWHGNDGTTLKLSRQLRTPLALKLGVLLSCASRVLELHIPMDRNQQASLRTWMDVISEKFKNLKHLHLMDDREDCDPSTITDESEIISDDGSVGFERSLRSLDRRQSVNNKRLYVLYRLPKLISINGKNVTVSERLQSRPTQQFKQHTNTQKTNVRLLEPIAAARIQKFNPMHDQLGLGTSGRSQIICFPEKSLSNNVDMSLLDEDDNEDDTTTIVADQCVEVKLSDCLIKNYNSQSGQASREDRDSILQRRLASSCQVAEGCVDTIAELDRLEYCTAVSTSIGACEWTTACGMMSLPAFPRVKQNTIRSPIKISLRNQNVQQETTPRSKTRLHQILKHSNISTKNILSSNQRNYDDNLSKRPANDNGGKDGSTTKLQAHLSTSKSVENHVTSTADSIRVESKINHLSDFGEMSHGSVTFPSLSQSDLTNKPNIAYAVPCSPVTTVIAESKQFVSPIENFDGFNADNIVDNEPILPTHHLSVRRNNLSSSHSLTSPFPIQFRQRGKSTSNLIKRTPAITRTSAGNLTVVTSRTTKELQSYDQAESMVPDLKVSNKVTNSNSVGRPRKSPSSYLKDILEIGATTVHKKPPPCPTSARRSIHGKSFSSPSLSSVKRLSVKKQSNNEHRHIRVGQIQLSERIRSILDDDDDNISTSEESKSGSDSPHT